MPQIITNVGLLVHGSKLAQNRTPLITKRLVMIHIMCTFLERRKKRLTSLVVLILNLIRA
uniref:Uncharacterized protein n=1 Tax=Solanum lycopersicum TaxID=4081 RepID=A0A3Q7ESR5_SOLLC